MGAGKKDAKQRQKELEKERKKRGSRKYGQAKMKHSRMGIYSCVYAGCAFAMILTCILIAFVLRGNTWGFVGGMGILSVVLAVLGIRASVKGMRERDKNYITCKAGLAGNIILLLGLLTIFIGGLK
ncbi:hypothetical protein HGO97_002095 [Faecalicatena sp. AGMB00832]|uniref:DUF4190 domain-containing protein n=1 Tax=Faecalicatena faecalis TaxID=2726362 RepID=A0ABS6D053_9FIRM|nr:MULTISPECIES: DUF6142 family protein [Faecalicatena]MBU3874602.1 hypothetical protein [Faecalicatena faecalis]MCI6464799.1 DUF6142 family protein [Faecalicatena sp.]MDY5619999.1 DUF6142 family protein [Lachnospiraceae bacterium]